MFCVFCYMLKRSTYTSRFLITNHKLCACFKSIGPEDSERYITELFAILNGAWQISIFKYFRWTVMGLNDDSNGLAVLTKLKRSGDCVYLLQETHGTYVNEQKLFGEWGNRRMCFSQGTSNSKGIALAITSNYDAKIINVINDADGRYLIADIERNRPIYTVGKLYAPTRNFEKEQKITLKKFITDLEKNDKRTRGFGRGFQSLSKPEAR